jgi:hypothetical protein
MVTDEKYNPVKWRIIWTLVAIPFVLLFVSIFKESPPKKITSEDAEYQCRGMIREILHDPSRAEFPLGRFETMVNADGSWTILREVRAPNAFNAMRRGTYECQVAYEAGSWRWLGVKQVD